MYRREMVFVTDHDWLTYVASTTVLIVVGVVAFFITRRWGRKAWPLLLCSALLVPVLGYAVAAIALYYVDLTLGLAGGFIIHLNRVILIALIPTAIGAAIGAVARKRAAIVR